jgi:hypothetical protein
MACSVTALLFFCYLDNLRRYENYLSFFDTIDQLQDYVEKVYEAPHYTIFSSALRLRLSYCFSCVTTARITALALSVLRFLNHTQLHTR